MTGCHDKSQKQVRPVRIGAQALLQCEIADWLDFPSTAKSDSGAQQYARMGGR
jgi:hypothetical protein